MSTSQDTLEEKLTKIPIDLLPVTLTEHLTAEKQRPWTISENSIRLFQVKEKRIPESI